MAFTILQIDSLDKIDIPANQFKQLLEKDKNSIYDFSGKMGAGKTTFIKAICKSLKVQQIVNSPTFSIVNEYTTEDGQIIYHFDFYRIKDTQEALDIGIEEYLYSGNLCLMEWAENIEGILPENITKVSIEEIENEIRIVTIE